MKSLVNRLHHTGDLWGGIAAMLVALPAAIAFGVTILFWPTKTAIALTGIIAFQAIVGGIIYLARGLTAKELGTGGRIGNVLLGLLYAGAGIVAFTQLQKTAAFLAVFLVIMMGALWVVEGFVALFSLGKAESKGLTIFFALISIIAGFTLISSPLMGAVFLWWFLALGMIVMGVLNVGRALFGRKKD